MVVSIKSRNLFWRREHTSYEIPFVTTRIHLFLVEGEKSFFLDEKINKSENTYTERSICWVQNIYPHNGRVHNV